MTGAYSRGMQFARRGVYPANNRTRGVWVALGFVVIVMIGVTTYFIAKRGESDTTSDDDTESGDTTPPAPLTDTPGTIGDTESDDTTLPTPTTYTPGTIGDTESDDTTLPGTIGDTEPGDTTPPGTIGDTESAPAQWTYKVKSPCIPETLPMTNPDRLYGSFSNDDGFPRKAWADVEVTSPEGVTKEHKFQCGVWKAGSTMDGGDKDDRVLQCDPRYFDGVPTDASRAKKGSRGDTIWTDSKYLMDGQGEVPFGLRCQQKTIPNPGQQLYMGNNTAGDRMWFNPDLSIPMPDANGYDTSRPGFIDQCIVTFAKHNNGNEGKAEEEQRFTVNLDPIEYSKLEDGTPVAAIGHLGSMNDNLRSSKSYAGCNMEVDDEGSKAKRLCIRMHKNTCKGDECAKWDKHTYDIGMTSEAGDNMWKNNAGGISSLQFFSGKCRRGYTTSDRKVKYDSKIGTRDHCKVGYIDNEYVSGVRTRYGQAIYKAKCHGLVDSFE